MKLPRLFFTLYLACAGLAVSGPSEALTVGRLRGAAVLGQPLDLSIPLQLSDNDDPGNLCPMADVYLGDFPVDSAYITARLTRDGGLPSIRLLVQKKVDEPVVTVYLKLGCQQQLMRKFVLLSEFASEVVSTESALNRAPVGAVALVRSSPESRDGNAQMRDSVAKPARSAANTAPQSDRSLTLDTRAPLPVAVKQASNLVAKMGEKSLRIKEPAAQRARLKLLPLDATQDWEPTLQLTHELSVLPGAADAIKQKEAAELWRAINASPEEVLQEAAKRAALDSELRSLIALSRENQAALAGLDANIKAAHEARLWNPVLYVLLILLLGCGAFLGYFLRGRRDLDVGTPWWHGAQVSGRTEDPIRPDVRAGDDGGVGSAAAYPVSVQVPAEAETPSREGVDIPLSESGFLTDLPTQSAAALPEVVPKADAKPTDFGHSMTGALRAINTQEMVDVRQQADFFLALGQHDDAVGVLHGALSHSTESNPHIYLDLIALLHKLSRKEEYEQIRLAFNALYTCTVPPYGAYSDSTRGLLDYPELCMPLVRLWPNPMGIDYIEKCLVREATDAADRGIDIEAFRDLLLLHGVLLSVAEDAVSGLPRSMCPKRVLPLLRRTAPGAHLDGFSAGPMDDGVDLDLSVGH